MTHSSTPAPLPDGDPLWYKDAVIYQTHVRAFFDSDGNGIGDFRGLTSKLDYLEELGVTTIWLLPFYPSPLKDDGYDIADYTEVHSTYGTLQDFTRFLKEAHRRNLRVITEMVVNHTSDQHPWFQRARRAPPGSRERDFYVWSDTVDKYRGTRIIFKDFEPSNWSPDPVAKSYYWHRFYSHQPDLNFDNPEVHKAIFQAMDFWLRRGVDGLRLDAVPYLYEREGTSCENLPETHAFLKELRSYIDQKYRHKMLLAEANQWPEDAAAYFGQGDECHMNFHFPLMPRLFMAIRMEDRYPVVDIMSQTPAIPENCQWATFLRNHDELTLEMVTDRERDYMYQVYARDREMRINLGIRRRLAPLLDNDRRAIELMNGLLFSMPGSPIIYYGDEIGMGDNVYLGDRNGVRTPMQWSADRNAGFSRANPQKLYLPVVIDPQFHYESVNVEAQENNPRTLLWWMRRLIGVRKRFTAFSRGSLDFLPVSNHKVLAFLRQYQDERVLVVANLSRFAQHVELDLSAFQGHAPVELFGQTHFRPVGPEPYYFTLGPYGFYWFALEPQRAELPAAGPARVAELTVAGTWESVFEGRSRAALTKTLPQYFRSCPWFGGRGRSVEAARILDAIRLVYRQQNVRLLLVQIEYGEGALESYALPLAFATGEQAEQLQEKSPWAVLARLKISDRRGGILYDALASEQFGPLLLESITRRRRFDGEAGELAATSGEPLRRLLESEPAEPIRGHNMEHAHPALSFGETLILKLFRRLESGINPDLEVGRFLTERGFANATQVVGSLEYVSRGREPQAVGILNHYRVSEGTAWQYTFDYMARYYENALAKEIEVHELPLPGGTLLEAVEAEAPPLAQELIGLYLERARLLGQRTAELHLALASDPENPNFAPEPFTDFYQRSQFQSLRNLRKRVLQMLRNRLDSLPEDLQAEARQVLECEEQISERFRAMRDRKFAALRIRQHGDLHLGKIQFTGRDFLISDFQGEPLRPLSERRGKHSAFRDVAGMLRSFHYISFAATFAGAEGALPAQMRDLEPWRQFWQAWVSAAYLGSYLATAGGAVFVPQDPGELGAILDLCVLEKALYELRFELENRLQWTRIPFQALLRLIRGEPTAPIPM